MYYDIDPALLNQCIESSIGPGVQDGPETDYTCPFCVNAGFASASHLHVNYRKNKALCHRCGWGCRDLKFLVLAILGKIPRSISRLTSDQDVEDVVYDILFKSAPTEQAVQDEVVTLPSDFAILTPNLNDRLGRVVLDYLTTRGVPFERLVEVGAGYCRDGALRGYAIFPVFVRGDLVTYTSRRVVGLGSKVRHAGASAAKRALFNYDNVQHARRVFIGEGPFDAWAFQKRLDAGDGGIATLGTSISSTQIRLIADLPCSEVVVCYDADAPTKALDVAAAISRSSSKTVSVMYPDRDPDEYSLDDLEKCVETRTVCDADLAEIESILKE